MSVAIASDTEVEFSKLFEMALPSFEAAECMLGAIFMVADSESCGDADETCYGNTETHLRRLGKWSDT